MHWLYKNLADDIKRELGIRAFFKDIDLQGSFQHLETQKTHPYEAKFELVTGNLKSYFRLQYLQAGHQIFLDQSYRDRFDTPALNFIDRKYKNPNTFLIGRNLVRYTALCLQALQGLPLQETHVLDLGAGDGILGMAALKSGARSLAAVEMNAHDQTTMAQLLTPNGLGFLYTSKLVQVIHANLRNHEQILQLLPYSGENITVVIANIGPHYGTKGDVGMAALHYLERLPQCRYFVGGGYVNDITSPYHPTQAFRFLASLGFEITDQFISINGTAPILAFIARKAHRSV